MLLFEIEFFIVHGFWLYRIHSKRKKQKNCIQLSSDFYIDYNSIQNVLITPHMPSPNADNCQQYKTTKNRIHN